MPSAVLHPHQGFAAFSAAILRLKPKASPFIGSFFRAVRPEYARSSDLVSGEGSRIHGGRWNPPKRFAAIYGSPDPASALAEALVLTRYYGVDPAQGLPLVVAACKVTLESVLDLTEPRILAELGVSLQDVVTEDWRAQNARQNEARTQAIGRAAAGIRLEGLWVPSSAIPGGKNIVIFPEALPATRTIKAAGIDHISR